jgi:predicted regulator of Ras-like GTPase activity (Roadblock/LC7/MglB family)
MQGKLIDMTVIDLIQHTCMEQKTARLTITRDNQSSTIFFQNGNMTHATCGNQQGEEAVYQIIRWEDGDFNLETGISAPVNTISHNWSGILLEGARRMDELSIEPDLLFDQSLDMGQDTMAKKIDEILKEMGGEITGHIASFVVGMDALSVASYSENKLDVDTASAQMTLLLKLIDTSVKKVQSDLILEDNLLTTTSFYLLTHFIPGDQYFLGIIADRKTAALGNLRLVSKIYAERIAKALPH